MSKPQQFKIAGIIDPKYPLLEKNRVMIEAIERKTYVYNTTTACQLDVYYPSSSPESTLKPPILIFFHGGGFTRGARTSPPALVHNNLGAFFALAGILTVIADYRLVPDAIFPEGATDGRDAVLWVIEHVSEGDTSRVFVMGHSAGGVHVATMLLLPTLFSPLLRNAIRGVVLMGVPYEVTNKKALPFRIAAEKYYEEEKKIALNQPLGLLRRAHGDHVRSLPPIRNILAQSEPRRVKSANRAFLESYKDKGGVVQEVVLEGHDHVSPILALMSGIGEDWGTDIVKWIL
ncbi:alpha/beta-hydrolase [Phlegmacium glaucopus]|nr:alpha/beta-hydrolase [Phlegmacium glaucopus]